MKKLLKEILYRMPPKTAHKILYYYTFKKRLNLKNPQNFNEKLQYLIVNEYDEVQTRLADKYLLHKYIDEKGYNELLPKLYGVYDNADEINFDELPNKFVLKTNHGSGEIFVCKNKNKFDIEKTKEKLNKSLKTNFAKQSLEYHYAKIKPKIICEQYLEDGKNELPIDYKFYCFNGKADCILICSNRSEKLKLDYYDLNWSKKDYSTKEYKSGKDFEKPKNLEKMIEIAEKLSKEFKFVRVDLYNINGKIYLGELTFTPAAGLIKYNTDEALNRWGKMLKL